MGKKKNAEKYSNITIYQSFTIILNFNPIANYLADVGKISIFASR